MGFLLTESLDYYKFVWIVKNPLNKGGGKEGKLFPAQKKLKGGFCP